MKNNKGFAPILIILIIAGVLAGGIYYFLKNKTSQPVACTQEAKICPDGSTVGRVGPNCQFAECPSVTDEAAGWKTYLDSKNEFEFKYPENFGANVWRPVFWPATTTVVSANEDPVAKGCGDLQSNSPAINSQKVIINNIDFTLYTAGDAGAGNLYSNYCYVTTKNQKYYVIYFLINSHTGCYQGGCGAYCQTQYEAECRNFDLARDVEKPIGVMMSTFQFLK
jgi:hypothetical protein